MTGLVERLRLRGDHARYLSTQNYVSSMQEGYAKDGDLDHEAADRIATLEAQVAAADRLAEFADESANPDELTDGCLCRECRATRLVAAYRAAKGE